MKARAEEKARREEEERIRREQEEEEQRLEAGQFNLPTWLTAGFSDYLFSCHRTSCGRGTSTRRGGSSSCGRGGQSSRGSRENRCCSQSPRRGACPRPRAHPSPTTTRGRGGSPPCCSSCRGCPTGCRCPCCPCCRPRCRRNSLETVERHCTSDSRSCFRCGRNPTALGEPCRWWSSQIPSWYGGRRWWMESARAGQARRWEHYPILADGSCPYSITRARQRGAGKGRGRFHACCEECLEADEVAWKAVDVCRHALSHAMMGFSGSPGDVIFRFLSKVLVDVVQVGTL